MLESAMPGTLQKILRPLAGLWVAGASIIFPGSAVELAGQGLPFSLKVDVSVVSVDVGVFDSNGNPVPNLSQEDFLVLEDGEPQQIQHFESTDVPYNSLLLFDVSGSTNSQSLFMLDAANRFLANLRLQDQVALASFDTQVTKLLDWRTRRGTSQQVPLPFMNRGTDLYGALEWVARELKQVAGRKGVIVLTDGLDRRISLPQLSPGEERDFERVLKAVETSESPFFFIALVRATGLPSTSPAARAVARMEKLAERSGGRVLYPRTIQDIATLYEGIARQLGASYSIDYASSRPVQDGTYRRIEVRLKRPGLRLSQSRDGYYAKDGHQQQTLSATSTGPTTSPNAKEVRGKMPSLVTPIAEALLSSPDKNEWRFNWEDVAGATKYQIAINAPDLGTPVLEAETRGTHYVVSKKPTYAGRNLKGWTWKVRAQTADGSWGPWSEVRAFDVFQ